MIGVVSNIQEEEFNGIHKENGADTGQGMCVEHSIYSGKVDCPKNLNIVYSSALKIV